MDNQAFVIRKKSIRLMWKMNKIDFAFTLNGEEPICKSCLSGRLRGPQAVAEQEVWSYNQLWDKESGGPGHPSTDARWTGLVSNPWAERPGTGRLIPALPLIGWGTCMSQTSLLYNRSTSHQVHNTGIFWEQQSGIYSGAPPFSPITAYFGWQQWREPSEVLVSAAEGEQGDRYAGKRGTEKDRRGVLTL